MNHMEIRKVKKLKFTVAILLLALVSSLGLSAPNSNAIPDSNADLNGDLFGTSQDISKLASCIGQDPHGNRGCKPADVDRDSDIDIDDYHFVSTRLGQSYPGLLFPLPQVYATSVVSYINRAFRKPLKPRVQGAARR
jgi:hypothetical protein